MLLTAAPIANAVYDYAGSYSPVLMISAGMSAVSIVFYIITVLIAHRKRKIS